MGTPIHTVVFARLNAERNRRSTRLEHGSQLPGVCSERVGSAGIQRHRKMIDAICGTRQCYWIVSMPAVDHRAVAAGSPEEIGMAEGELQRPVAVQRDAAERAPRRRCADLKLALNLRQ